MACVNPAFKRLLPVTAEFKKIGFYFGLCDDGSLMSPLSRLTSLSLSLSLALALALSLSHAYSLSLSLSLSRTLTLSLANTLSVSFSISLSDIVLCL